MSEGRLSYFKPLTHCQLKLTTTFGRDHDPHETPVLFKLAITFGGPE